MRLLKLHTVTVTRYPVPTYVKGRKVVGTPITFSFECHIQSIPVLTKEGGETLTLEEQGNEDKLKYKVYSEELLQHADVITDTDGSTYRVIKIYDWHKTGLAVDHYKALAEKEVN